MKKIDENWTKRNIADAAKAEEIVKFYKELGYSVKSENFNPETDDIECNECMKENPERFKIIYTKPGTNTPEDILYD